MLERLAFAAAPHQIAQRRQFRFVQFALEFQIQFETFAAKNVREQVLGVQTGIVDLALLEILGARLQHLENGHVLEGGAPSRPIIYGADGAAPSIAESFNRSATSAACNVLIISPRSPSITRSRL